MDPAARKLIDEATGKDATKEVRRVRFQVEVTATEELIAYLDQKTDEVLMDLVRQHGDKGRDYAARLQPHRDEFATLSMMRMSMELGSVAINELGRIRHVGMGMPALDGSDIVAMDDGQQILVRIHDVMFTR
ncbi:MAG TPA: hypothetical protein VGK41_01355 [Solirubrobacterales bacterium]